MVVSENVVRNVFMLCMKLVCFGVIVLCSLCVWIMVSVIRNVVSVVSISGVLRIVLMLIFLFMVWFDVLLVSVSSGIIVLGSVVLMVVNSELVMFLEIFRCLLRCLSVLVKILVVMRIMISMNVSLINMKVMWYFCR